MPSFCAVVNCNDRYGHSESVSFHKFPLKRKDLLAQWEAFIQQQRGTVWRASRWSSLCSRHFREDDFRSLNERKTLKKSAVPSVLGEGKEKSKKNICDSEREEEAGDKEFTEIMAIKERLEDVGGAGKTNCRLCGIWCVAAATFTTNYELYGMLQKCFPTLNIQQEDALPKALCGSCNKNLQHFGDFVDRVWTAQTELQRKYKSRAAEKPVKIKQEPCVPVKQEVAEYGYDQKQHETCSVGNEDYDTIPEGTQEEGEESGTVDHKYEFCDFPIINDCDIMEIINLDDPFINIPDDDNTEAQTEELERSIGERTNYLPSAHELLQEHLLMEEHNYAYVDNEEFKEERRVYKTEKTEIEERPLDPSKVLDETENRTVLEGIRNSDNINSHQSFVENLNYYNPETCEKRALKPIVTSVSAIQQPGKANSIIVLNESIVKSGGGFQLHECMVCQLKFFSIESLKEHYTQMHGTPMVTVPAANIAQERSAEGQCKTEKEVNDSKNCPQILADGDSIPKGDSNGSVDCALETCTTTLENATNNKQDCNLQSNSNNEIKDSATKSGNIKINHKKRVLKKRDRHISLNTMACQYQQLRKLYHSLQKKCLNLEQNVEQLQLHPVTITTKSVNSSRVAKSKTSQGTEEKYISQADIRCSSFTCPECSKSFSNSNSFRQHKITHSDERRHTCSLCQRMFKRRNGLLQHLKGFHLQVKPFVCTVCKHSYALKCDMLRCKHSALKGNKYTE